MSDRNRDGQDPLEMLRQMWSGAGIPLPGMVAPTLDIDDLDKRISDLKTVENWLRMNLNMLQATIQGLEVQRATLSTLKSMSEQAAHAKSGQGGTAGENPFAAAAAMWPWNLMNPANPTAAPSDVPPEQTAPPSGRKSK